jgi:heptosyltransferase-1
MPGRNRPPLDEYPARRIALLKPSALGDIVHCLPVLTALRRRYPRAHITWVVNRSYEPLLAGHRDLDATLSFDRGAGLWAGVRTFARLLLELRRQCFDLVVDLQGLFRTGLMAAATWAPRRVGLSTAREGAVWFYTDVVPVADFDALHAVDRCWLVAQALGAGRMAKEFHVPLGAEARAWAERMLAGRPRPWLVLGAGSRWMTKRWPPAHFAALARRARADFGGTVLLVGGKDEAALSLAVRERLGGPVLDLTGATTLPQLAALLARADVVLANDSGPGPARRRPLYLHQGAAQRPLRPGGRLGRDDRVVPGQLPEALLPPGVHERADPSAALAAAARGAAYVAEPSPVRLILASASPARRELLARTGWPFEVLPADVRTGRPRARVVDRHHPVAPARRRAARLAGMQPRPLRCPDRAGAGPLPGDALLAGPLRGLRHPGGKGSLCARPGGQREQRHRPAAGVLAEEPAAPGPRAGGLKPTCRFCR